MIKEWLGITVLENKVRMLEAIQEIDQYRYKCISDSYQSLLKQLGYEEYMPINDAKNKYKEYEVRKIKDTNEKI